MCRTCHRLTRRTQYRRMLVQQEDRRTHANGNEPHVVVLFSCFPCFPVSLPLSLLSCFRPACPAFLFSARAPTGVRGQPLTGSASGSASAYANMYASHQAHRCANHDQSSVNVESTLVNSSLISHRATSVSVKPSCPFPFKYFETEPVPRT